MTPTVENTQPGRSAWDFVWLICHRCGRRHGVARGLQAEHQRCHYCRSTRIEVTEAPDLNTHPYRPERTKRHG